MNSKQCRSRSVGFFRSQLIWIYTVCKDRVYQGSAGQGLRDRVVSEKWLSLLIYEDLYKILSHRRTKIECSLVKAKKKSKYETQTDVKLLTTLTFSSLFWFNPDILAFCASISFSCTNTITHTRWQRNHLKSVFRFLTLPGNWVT